MSTPSQVLERLAADINAAARGRLPELGVLRLVKAALANERIKHGAGSPELIEAEVLTVLRRELKRRQESATVYEGAGRAELAAKENEEAVVISRYLPPPVEASEIAAVAKRIASERSLVAPSGIGPLTKAIVEHFQGAVDGGTASAAARVALNS